ncbi:MAG: hypothetical protein RQ758_04795 [Methanomicrobiaceae archaeon]|nr:hypothetical protein [Methanomicrobiaceae archaeon]
MQIAEIFNKIITNSEFSGDYSFDDLIDHMRSQGLSGLGVAEVGSQHHILIFVHGEPEGAVLIEEKGMLFGDKAVFLLTQFDTYRLFVIDPEIGESLAARCKIYNRSHLKGKITEEIPVFGGVQKTLGRICVVIKKQDAVQNGVRVSLRKGRQVLASDITAGDGRACFKVLNGTYDCVVIDREQKMYRFRVDFKEPFTESVIDIGGVT